MNFIHLMMYSGAIPIDLPRLRLVSAHIFSIVLTDDSRRHNSSREVHYSH